MRTLTVDRIDATHPNDAVPTALNGNTYASLEGVVAALAAHTNYLHMHEISSRPLFDDGDVDDGTTVARVDEYAAGNLEAARSEARRLDAWYRGCPHYRYLRVRINYAAGPDIDLDEEQCGIRVLRRSVTVGIRIA